MTEITGHDAEIGGHVGPKYAAEAFFELKRGLERLFARPVDLVVERAIRNPYFRQRVSAERQPVYGA